MKLLYVVVATLAVLAGNCDGVTAPAATDSTQSQVSKITPPDPPPSINANIRGQDYGAKTRFLRAVRSPDEGNNSTGSLNETLSVARAASGLNDEERAIKLPGSSILKNKKITSAVTSLLTSNKNKMTPAKLRVKFLEKLPLDLQSKLIFAKMPANLPAKLPSKLPIGFRPVLFQIPGVGNAAAQLQMQIWYFYRIPPMFVFRKLGLVGKGTGIELKMHRNYKYFEAYAEKWIKSQRFMEL